MARDIIDQYRPRRAAVVRSRHGPEAFRPRRVPELQLDPFPPRTGPDTDDLGCELDADGLGGEGAPFGLDEAVEEAGPVDEQ
jgi:hypothetical protein